MNQPRHALPGVPSIRRSDVYEPIEIAKHRSRFLAAAAFRPELAQSLIMRGRAGSQVRAKAEAVLEHARSRKRLDASIARLRATLASLSPTN